MSATCSGTDGSGTGTANFTGRYTDDGSAFSLVGIEGSGTMTLTIAWFTTTQPLPIVPSSAAGVPYQIDGDVLTYSFQGATQTFTRTG